MILYHEHHCPGAHWDKQPKSKQVSCLPQSSSQLCNHHGAQLHRWSERKQPMKVNIFSLLHQLGILYLIISCCTWTSKCRIPSVLLEASRTTANASKEYKNQFQILKKMTNLLLYIFEHNKYQPACISASVSPLLNRKRNSAVFPLNWKQ